MSQYIVTKPLSQTYQARYLRNRRLHDETGEYLLLAKNQNIKRKGKKLSKQIDEQNHHRYNALYKKRIAFHLSKGRDVGTIACRERMKVSRVLELIEQMNRSK